MKQTGGNYATSYVISGVPTMHVCNHLCGYMLCACIPVMSGISTDFEYPCTYTFVVVQVMFDFLGILVCMYALSWLYPLLM